LDVLFANAGVPALTPLGDPVGVGGFCPEGRGDLRKGRRAGGGLKFARRDFQRRGERPPPVAVLTFSNISNERRDDLPCPGGARGPRHLRQGGPEGVYWIWPGLLP